MPICIDLLEYGYSSFSLEILEYCDPSKCIEREGDFIKLFSPEYNIIQDPTVPPMSGRTHSDDSKKKMSAAKSGENNPCYGRTGEQNPMFGRTGQNHPSYGEPKPEGSGRPFQKIEVLDLNTNEPTTYDSIHAAARALNILQSSISKYFANNQQKPYKGRYIFTKVG